MPSRRVTTTTTSLALAVLAGCAATRNELSARLLVPPPAPLGSLVQPADFGFAAEAVDIELHRDASLTGWWLPNPEAQRRTVVLFHDGDTDSGCVHPYYRMLHRAGFQVLVFDPRGYGRSRGQATLQAWLYDLPALFDWLRARDDVDPQRIALFGTGLGSVAALWAARTQGCQALVLEHLPSLRALAVPGHDGNSALSALTAGFAEFANLPEQIEPDDNAPSVKVPALFVTSDGEPARDRLALVRTFARYGGPAELWLQAATARAPHGMLTHDGEYERRLSTFLAAALAGDANPLRSEWRSGGERRDGKQDLAIEVSGPATAERVAVEVAAVLPDGSCTFARTWLEQGRARTRLTVAATPLLVGATVVPGAVADDTTFWRREPTALARAAAAVDPLWDRIGALREGALPPADLLPLADALAAAEASAAFPPQLDAELADVWSLLGQQLRSNADPALAARGRALLQRAVAAAPARPELHDWPGPIATYGYPQQDAVDAARRLLATTPQ